MKNNQRQFFGIFAVAILFLFVSFGCGKKTDAPGEISKSGSTNGPGSTSGPAMPGANPSSDKPAGPPIKSTTLADYLPKLSGFEAKSPEHMDWNMNGMSWASAKSEYVNGDNRVTVTILDYNHQMGLAAAYSMYTAGNLNIETDEEITRSEKVGGYPGWLNWRKKDNNGTVGVIVNDRIFVVVESSKASSIDDLKAIAEKVDLAGLAKIS